MNCKRYFIYAKRKGEEWSGWVQTDILENAIKQSKIISGLGFCSKILDRSEKREIEFNG